MLVSMYFIQVLSTQIRIGCSFKCNITLSMSFSYSQFVFTCKIMVQNDVKIQYVSSMFFLVFFFYYSVNLVEKSVLTRNVFNVSFFGGKG